MTTLLDNLFNAYYLQNTKLSDSMHYPTTLPFNDETWRGYRSYPPTQVIE